MSAAPVLSKVRKISLEVASGPLKGGVFHFAKPLIMIGRGLENDVVLEEDSKISRMHVEIKQSNGMITVQNVTEKNTVLLNGQLIKTAVIEGPARLLLGDTELYIRLDMQPAGPQPARSPQVQQAPGLKIVPGAASVQNPYMYQQAAPGQAGKAYKPPKAAKAPPNPKLLLYAIIGLVILGGAYFTSETVAKHRRNLQLKSSEEVEAEVKLATESVDEIRKKLEEKQVDSRSYQTAQQQYVRGFRDFNQGQYGRAIRELSAAITYYPQHELARRYLTMAQKKLDEIVRAELELGQKYRAQRSYRMCVASFKKVTMLLDDPEDKVSKEAQQLLDECELQQKEHY